MRAERKKEAIFHVIWTVFAAALVALGMHVFIYPTDFATAARWLSLKIME